MNQANFLNIGENAIIDTNDISFISFDEINDDTPDVDEVVYRAEITVELKSGSTFRRKSTDLDSLKNEFEHLKQILVY